MSTVPCMLIVVHCSADHQETCPPSAQSGQNEQSRESHLTIGLHVRFPVVDEVDVLGRHLQLTIGMIVGVNFDALDVMA
eukprot:CAMPEP_0170173816 /NCGR_PEP_ID=MMETSP0040_2-20121228/7083_1 /TAXON_ID=641309 /ORGANISM="Lotharella oceanica, Strain CCMP622" /LENGTH=78 /DNA_ID=CAMNT_0010415177 /DNA_START=225 /DNA_END=461 /DNA_ORIENTATION=+